MPGPCNKESTNHNADMPSDDPDLALDADDLGEEFMEAAREQLLTCRSYAVEQWCYKCQQMCPLEPPVFHTGTQLRIAVAGYCCQPWSQMGKKEKWLSPLSLPWISWIAGLWANTPEIVVGECTQHFAFSTMKKYLDEIYVLSELTFSPKDQGIPVARVRQYVLAVRKDIIIMEPYNDETFQAVFARRLLLDASVFFRAPNSRVLSEKSKAFEKRPHLVDDTSAVTCSWSELLMASHRVRLTGYLEIATEKQMAFFVADLNQRPHFMQPSSICPALLRHGHVYGRTLDAAGTRAHIDRPMLVEELLATQCIPVLMPAKHPLTQVVPRLLRFRATSGAGPNLTESQYKALVGNGMVLAQVGVPLLMALFSVQSLVSV